MLKQLQRWLGKPAHMTALQERLLALEREAQSLRLELAEREKLLAHVETTSTRQRADEERRVREAVESQMEKLIADTATPVTQLLAQAHLLEAAGKPLQARDVLAVAKRVVRVLEENGLKLENAVGETVPFDSNRHEPLSADTSIAPGCSAVIRFAGVSFRGKLLRKAKVESAATVP